jgi:hypothetical protein
LLTNWGACHAKLGDDDDEKERRRREIEVLVELQKHIADRLESEVGIGELNEVAKEGTADSEMAEGLDDEEHGEERKRLEVEGAKRRFGKRETPDLEYEDTGEGDAVSTSKTKRPKVSTQQLSPIIRNPFQYDKHISSKIKTGPQEDDSSTALDQTSNANTNADEERSDAESYLSIVSNITELASTPQRKPHPQHALLPAQIHQTRAQILTPTTPVFVPAKLTDGNLATKEQDGSLGVLDPHRSYLHHALNTLEFQKRRDCPVWIIGLRKPIHQAGLTDVQNLEITIRMWDDEIERLISIHDRLPIPAFEDFNDDSDSIRSAQMKTRAKKGKDKGEWTYSHWTHTHEFQFGRSKKRVFARGMWTWVVGKEVQGMLLDEWPRDVWGEPLGWAVKRESGENDGYEEEDEDGMEESEDEEDWDEMIRGMGDGLNDTKECTTEMEEVGKEMEEQIMLKSAPSSFSSSFLSSVDAGEVIQDFIEGKVENEIKSEPISSPLSSVPLSPQETREETRDEAKEGDIVVDLMSSPLSSPPSSFPSSEEETEDPYLDVDENDDIPID